MFRAITSLIALCFLAACGLKGPLYLPEKDAQEQTVPAEVEREAQENKPDSPLLQE